MSFPKRKQENLPRQSLFNRLKTSALRKDGAEKQEQKLQRRASKLSEHGERERAWCFLSESELSGYLGPVDKTLVVNAEIAKRRRRFSIQLASSDLRNFKGRPRSKTTPPSIDYPTKQTPFNSVRCKWCEPIELPGVVVQKNSDDETYIDGIYTTVLCFTEI